MVRDDRLSAIQGHLGMAASLRDLQDPPAPRGKPPQATQQVGRFHAPEYRSNLSDCQDASAGIVQYAAAIPPLAARTPRPRRASRRAARRAAGRGRISLPIRFSSSAAGSSFASCGHQPATHRQIENEPPQPRDRARRTGDALVERQQPFGVHLKAAPAHRAGRQRRHAVRAAMPL